MEELDWWLSWTLRQFRIQDYGGLLEPRLYWEEWAMLFDL